MDSQSIMPVYEHNFENEVIQFSQHFPVLVEFWADWSKSSKQLSPLLERIAKQAHGQFRLARVNADQNPMLTKQLHIQTVPFIKAFQFGKIVGEFSGPQTELYIRDFMDRVFITEADIRFDKGNVLMDQGEYEMAEEAYYDVLQDNPDHPGALLGRSKALIAMGETSTALVILNNFPPSREFRKVDTILPAALALAWANEQDQDYDLDDPLFAAFLRSLKLVPRGNIPAALDGLLDIIREDKNYRGGEVRKAFLGFVELLDQESDMVRGYRKELASILF